MQKKTKLRVYVIEEDADSILMYISHACRYLNDWDRYNGAFNLSHVYARTTYDIPSDNGPQPLHDRSKWVQCIARG